MLCEMAQADGREYCEQTNDEMQGNARKERRDVEGLARRKRKEVKRTPVAAAPLSASEGRARKTIFPGGQELIVS